MSTHSKIPYDVVIFPNSEPLSDVREQTDSSSSNSQSSELRVRTWAQNSATRAIVHCIGDIVYYREADHLVDVVSRYDQREVVIDLKHVQSVDAYGLGKLLDLFQLLARREQCLTLANPSHRLQELFRITRLDFCFMCACGRVLT